MDAETRKQLTLVKDEWNLVIELLERERKELHAEIHRTDSRDYRAKLSQRLDLVNQLLKMLCLNNVT
jgi:hypothetical protein